MEGKIDIDHKNKRDIISQSLYRKFGFGDMGKLYRKKDKTICLSFVFVLDTFVYVLVLGGFLGVCALSYPKPTALTVNLTPILSLTLNLTLTLTLTLIPTLTLALALTVTVTLTPALTLALTFCKIAGPFHNIDKLSMMPEKVTLSLS